MTEPGRKSWWLMAQCRGGEPAVWHLGDATHEDLAELVDAARVVLGIPVTDGGSSAEWDVQLGYDEPHDTLLARATMRDPAELMAVATSAIVEFRAAVHEAGRQGRLEAARAALGDLAPDELDELLGGRG